MLTYIEWDYSALIIVKVSFCMIKLWHFTKFILFISSFFPLTLLLVS